MREQICSIFRKHRYVVEDRDCEKCLWFYLRSVDKGGNLLYGIVQSKIRGKTEGEMDREGERGRSYSWRIAKQYFEFHSDGTRDSEINQIQSHNSDYRVRNLIYLHVIVVPFILRYGIPLDAVNGWRYRRGGTWRTGMNLADPSWP